MIEADLHQVYGIDLSSPGLMRERSWRWLKVRIGGLLSTECRVQRRFEPPEPKQTRMGARRWR